LGQPALGTLPTPSPYWPNNAQEERSAGRCQEPGSSLIITMRADPHLLSCPTDTAKTLANPVMDWMMAVSISTY